MIQCTWACSTILLTESFEDSFGMEQAEADTTLFTMYKQACENGWQGTVVIDSDNTNAHVQGCYISNNVDTEIDKKKSCLDCRSFVSNLVAKVIIQVDIMTSSDYNSGFDGYRKKSVMQKLTKSSEAKEHLCRCCGSLPAST